MSSITHLQEQNFNLKEEFKSLQLKVVERDTIIGRCNAMIGILEDRLKEAEKEIVKARSTEHNLHVIIMTQKQIIQDEKDQATKFLKLADERQASIEIQHRELDIRVAEIRELHVRYRDKAQRLEECTQTSLNRKNQIESLRQDIDKRDEAIASIDKELIDLKSSYSKLQLSNGMLQKSIEAKDQLMGELIEQDTKTMEGLREQILKAAQENKELREKQAEYLGIMQSLNDSLVIKNEDIATIQERWTATSTELEKERTDRKRIIEQTGSMFDQQNKQIEQLNLRIRNLTAENKEFNDDLLETEKTIRSNYKAIEHFKETIAGKNRQLDLAMTIYYILLAGISAFYLYLAYGKG